MRFLSEHIYPSPLLTDVFAILRALVEDVERCDIRVLQQFLVHFSVLTCHWHRFPDQGRFSVVPGEGVRGKVHDGLWVVLHTQVQMKLGRHFVERASKFCNSNSHKNAKCLFTYNHHLKQFLTVIIFFFIE